MEQILRQEDRLPGRLIIKLINFVQRRHVLLFHY
jgi:hypothetical protein